MPWFHDGANSGGGGGQVPIHALYDVTIAGYNILVDPLRQTRSLDDTSAPSTTNFLTTYWATLLPPVSGVSLSWGYHHQCR